MDNVIVQNFPTDFPDSELLNQVKLFKNNAPTRSDITALLNSIASLINRSEVSINNGAISVKVADPPADYPDAALLQSSTSIDGRLADANTNIRAVRTEVIHTEEALQAISTLVNSLLSEVQSKNNDDIVEQASQVKISNASIASSSQAIVSQLEEVITGLTSLISALNLCVKTTDIATSNGVVKCQITNNAVDYPDAAAHTALNEIKSVCGGIAADGVSIKEALPEGNHCIGGVLVKSSVLPAGAAKADLQNKQLRLSEQFFDKFLKDFNAAVINIGTSVAHIRNYICNADSRILYFVKNIDVSEKAFKSEVLRNVGMGRLRVHYASDILAPSTRLTVYTSSDGKAFYPVKDASSITMSAGEYSSIDLSGTMQYLYVEVQPISKLSGKIEITIQSL